MIHSFIHFWHAPLWVRRPSAKRRQHSPEWTILCHVNCFVEGEVQWFPVLLGSLHPRSTGASRCIRFSSPRGKLLRSVWHLIRLTFAQCGRTGRVAVLEQYRSRKMWLDLKRISPWNHAEAGRIPPPPESPCGSLGDATGRWKGIRPEKHLLQQFANVS